MKFDAEFIERVQKANNIVDVIQDDLDLKSDGANLQGTCPFCSSDGVSFSVSPSRQVFYCFNCKESGNVFTYATKIKKMNLEEAVRWLADRAHLSA